MEEKFGTKYAGDLALTYYVASDMNEVLFAKSVATKGYNKKVALTVVSQVESKWEEVMGLTMQSRFQMSRDMYRMFVRLLSMDNNEVTQTWTLCELHEGVHYPTFATNAGHQTVEKAGHENFGAHQPQQNADGTQVDVSVMSLVEHVLTNKPEYLGDATK